MTVCPVVAVELTQLSMGVSVTLTMMCHVWSSALTCVCSPFAHLSSDVSEVSPFCCPCSLAALGWPWSRWPRMSCFARWHQYLLSSRGCRHFQHSASLCLSSIFCFLCKKDTLKLIKGPISTIFGSGSDGTPIYWNPLPVFQRVSLPFLSWSLSMISFECTFTFIAFTAWRISSSENNRGMLQVTSLI